MGDIEEVQEQMKVDMELVGLGSSSSMDSFASWKMNGNEMEKEEREETPLQGEDESRRSSHHRRPWIRA